MYPFNSPKWGYSPSRKRKGKKCRSVALDIEQQESKPDSIRFQQKLRQLNIWQLAKRLRRVTERLQDFERDLHRWIRQMDSAGVPASAETYPDYHRIDALRAMAAQAAVEVLVRRKRAA